MLKTMIILFLAMACAGIGNILMRKGLQTMGVMPSRKIGPLFRFFFKATTNPMVLLGIIISIGYFALWLVVLSWAEVSWALPMNAVEYPFVAVTAAIFLKEEISFHRWIGIGFIFLGMILMMGSWGN